MAQPLSGVRSSYPQSFDADYGSGGPEAPKSSYLMNEQGAGMLTHIFELTGLFPHTKSINQAL